MRRPGAVNVPIGEPPQEKGKPHVTRVYAIDVGGHHCATLLPLAVMRTRLNQGEVEWLQGAR
jgi:hypothetical protein